MAEGNLYKHNSQGYETKRIQQKAQTSGHQGEVKRIWERATKMQLFKEGMRLEREMKKL